MKKQISLLFVMVFATVTSVFGQNRELRIFNNDEVIGVYSVGDVDSMKVAQPAELQIYDDDVVIGAYAAVNMDSMKVIQFAEHEYVDLALPSGTLWATMNIGANAPEEYGYPFAWAETKTKSGFGWGVYKYSYGSEKTLKKYIDRSGYGDIIDNKMELDLLDDAAYICWGMDWRMPSKAQFLELINSEYTTTEWTTMNGVNGRKITSNTNGKSIFLPAAGFNGGSYSTTNGYYWSRSLNNGGPCYADYLMFSANSIYTNNRYRYYGHTVRAVRAQ
ncbi:MAG: hypothetical protein J6Y39_07140 [Bacteroidaceae bacterium]|nr:hypothetical protein [Bacteroidaceae bacterium]